MHLCLREALSLLGCGRSANSEFGCCADMSKRRTITELGLGFFSRGTLLLHPKDIRRIDEQSAEVRALAESCHIYLIVTRPRVSFVVDSVKQDGAGTVGAFSYRVGGSHKQSEFFISGKPDCDNLRVSDYPHNSSLLIEDENVVGSYPAYLLATMCDWIEDRSLRDLEVQYVGMSYADGKRSAKDRLASHSTLQQVLADVNQDAPDSDVQLLLVEYVDPQTFVTFDGRDRNLRIEKDKDLVSSLQQQDSRVTKDLQIALVEAGSSDTSRRHTTRSTSGDFRTPTQRSLKKSTQSTLPVFL